MRDIFEETPVSVFYDMPILYPRYRAEHVTDLTAERLAQLGIKALLLDVDCTLKRYTRPMPAQDVLDWIDAMRRAGIFLCLVSNGKGPRIAQTAAKLNLPYIALALKPLPRGCRRALKEYSLRAGETAMVGDQLLADIVAGNMAGLTTILVTPIHPEEEHLYTRVKRPLEKFFLLFRKAPKITSVDP